MAIIDRKPFKNKDQESRLRIQMTLPLFSDAETIDNEVWLPKNSFMEGCRIYTITEYHQHKYKHFDRVRHNVLELWFRMRPVSFEGDFKVSVRVVPFDEKEEFMDTGELFYMAGPLLFQHACYSDSIAVLIVTGKP